MSNQSLPPGASSPRDEPPSGRREARSPFGRREVPRESAREEARPGPASERDRRERNERDESAAGPAAGSGPTMALILHALTFLCCFNWIFGVIGIVFAVRAGHKRDQGRYVEAETLTRYSWYCLGAAAVMFAVMLVLTLWLFTQAGSLFEGVVVPY
ncbi:CD225/dispanin family protein [Streptomonospora wellingtoniae]|uniref:DUF4190 domain-containing protein n=1 Tax=Streptomonospora wellingtoniae TaxID=3075544 RepID=A0ABU2KY02_9ACTN|nr:hypothetical protein [Streptomonospora sp. DSM 45055]MDT0304186.1 hypothetical protein [Streptomonospora sp. DSM 45055]